MAESSSSRGLDSVGGNHHQHHLRILTHPTVIAFLSWYAFPPLLPLTIKKDLHLSANEIANSNIIALTAT